MPASDLTSIQQSIVRLTDKLDALISTMPATYAIRTEFEKRMETAERRIDANETRLQAQTARMDELNRAGMQWANESFTQVQKQVGEETKTMRQNIIDLEHRIMEKMDQHLTTGRANRLMLVVSTSGWALTLAIFIISHFWR